MSAAETTTTPDPSFAAPAALLRSYGPLAAVAVAFLLMAAACPRCPRPPGLAGAVAVPDLASPGDDGTPGSDGCVRRQGGARDAAAGGHGGAGEGQPTPAAGGCTDRTLQVPGDPYSPPCYAFAATTAAPPTRASPQTSIIVTVRTLEGPSAAEIFADISGQSVNDSPEAVTDTILRLAEYFSQRFQLYGRKIEHRVLPRARATAPPSCSAAARRRRWPTPSGRPRSSARSPTSAASRSPTPTRWPDRASSTSARRTRRRSGSSTAGPYSWSLFPDGTNVVRSRRPRLLGPVPAGLRPRSTAGAAVNGKPRKFAVVAPENAEYQESVNAYLDLLAKAGRARSRSNMKYKLDISSMPNQASNIIAQLKDAGDHHR